MRLRPLALSTAATAALAVVAGGLAPVAASAAASCSSFAAPLHQLVNPSTTGSLVSVWSTEVSSAVGSRGFTDAGVVARVAGSNDDGLTAVHRVRKATDYQYAASSSDLADAKKAGYAEESQPFYAATSGSDSCSVPVWQLTLGGKHRLAAGDAARTSLLSQGWTDGAVVFYAASAGTTATPDPAPSSPSSPAPSPAPSSGDDPYARPVPTGPTAGVIKASDSDTTFTIAALPDIQRETHVASDPRIANRSNWLVANQAKLDIRFAAIVGDISDWDTPDHSLYANASQGLLPLQAKIPYAAAPGNHDTAAVCAGGSACPDAKTWLTVRNTATYNKYFPESRFGALAGEYEQGKTDNAYHLFRAGGKDWMVINIELWPRKEVVAWVAKLVADNPKKNVILVTHSYLESNGAISKSNGGYGATAPTYLYEKAVKPYGNVKLILSGHTGLSAIRTDTTDKGTKVVSMLQCFHSNVTNPVRLIEIDTKAGSMSSWVYAPYTKQTFDKFAASAKGVKFVG